MKCATPKNEISLNTEKESLILLKTILFTKYFLDYKPLIFFYLDSETSSNVALSTDA